jgi:hypothetical protein
MNGRDRDALDPSFSRRKRECASWGDGVVGRRRSIFATRIGDAVEVEGEGKKVEGGLKRRGQCKEEGAGFVPRFISAPRTKLSIKRNRSHLEMKQYYFSKQAATHPAFDVFRVVSLCYIPRRTSRKEFVQLDEMLHFLSGHGATAATQPAFDVFRVVFLCYIPRRMSRKEFVQLDEMLHFFSGHGATGCLLGKAYIVKEERNQCQWALPLHSD